MSQTSYTLNTSNPATFTNITIPVSGTSATDLWVNTSTSGVTLGDLKPSGKITLTGNDADVDINGKSLKEFMQQVEERLAILQPNPKLEKEWEELKALGDQYRQLEQEIKDKMKTWDILNKP